MTPYKSYHELELEVASLRAQLANAQAIVDSYAAEMREESLERDAIDWLADEYNVTEADYQAGVNFCVVCQNRAKMGRKLVHEDSEETCLHLRAKAYKLSQKENGQ